MKVLLAAGAVALAICFAPVGANAAPYSAQVLIGNFICQGAWCTANFPAVPAGKTLTVTNVSCIFTASSFIDAQIQYPVGSKTYYQGLALEWQRPNGGMSNATFGKDNIRFQVEAGKRPSAVIQIGGSLAGAHCELWGDLN